MTERAARTATRLIASCDGGSAAAARAACVAAELVARGLGQPLPGDAGVTALRGRRVVAIDGCAAACCGRRLESLGIEVEAALNLGDMPPGVSAEDAVAARLGGSTAPARRRGPRRRPRPALLPGRTPPAPRPHGVDDYLFAIDELAASVVECGAFTSDAPTLAAHVSQALGVTRPSAGEMLARLETMGLVERSGQRQILLTPSGRAAADRVVRRHRLLERFAVDVLGYSLAEAFEHARELAGGFDDQAIGRLDVALRGPDRCPHGWLVDAAAARAEARTLQALATVPVGAEAEVVCLDERDRAALSELERRGIAPRTRLARTGPDDSDLAVGGQVTRLSRAAQQAVLVRLWPPPRSDQRPSE